MLLGALSAELSVPATHQLNDSTFHLDMPSVADAAHLHLYPFFPLYTLCLPPAHALCMHLPTRLHLLAWGCICPHS